MIYRVKARWWNDDFTKRFGLENSVHELSDAEVLSAIKELGRASIIDDPFNKEAPPHLDFQNDYD